MHQSFSDEIKRVFAARVKIARKECGYSQNRTADELGVARMTYIDLEAGKTSLKVSMLFAIADLFNTDPLWLIGYTPEERERDICQSCRTVRVKVAELARVLDDGY